MTPTQEKIYNEAKASGPGRALSISTCQMYGRGKIDLLQARLIGAE
jgi:hypothetical protein